MDVFFAIAVVGCITWIGFLTLDLIRTDKTKAEFAEQVDDYRVHLFEKRVENDELLARIAALTSEVTNLKAQLDEERDRSCRAASLLLDDLPSSD